MKRLLLMRHAKSDWSVPGQHDKDRKLAKRGRMAAPLMAYHINALQRDFDFGIDAIIVSDAARARETIAAMQPILHAPQAILTFDERIYHALPDDILKIVGETSETATALLIVGHNPTLEQTAYTLARGDACNHFKFATAAVAFFQWRGAWRDCAYGDVRLLSFESPKTLV
jgi:phosphohistidine phosphatase